MKVDRNLVEELYKKHMYKDKQGVKANWSKITKEYQEIKQLARQPKRDSLRYVVMGRTEELWNQENDNEEPLSKNKELEILADGTQKLLAYKQMSEEQSKDPDYVMQINGYDPSKWELVRLRVNEWTARNSDDEELYNYQIRLDVKPKSINKITLADIRKANKEYTYKHPFIKPTKIEGNYALEIGLTDIHIGSPEFDELLFLKTIVDIAEYAKSVEGLEKIYLNWYGDVIHVDNTNKTTTRGTQLEMPMSAYDMYQKAKEIIDFTITEFAFTNINFIWVQGNHSRFAEYALFDGTKDRWINNKHIKFDVDERRRKAFLYGNQLVGVYHGDLAKAQTFDWLARDFDVLWGKSKYREQHSGHLHHEAVQTKAGIVSRTLTTVKDTDSYEDGLGYRNISRVVQTFLYEKQTGLKQINYW